MDTINFDVWNNKINEFNKTLEVNEKELQAIHLLMPKVQEHGISLSLRAQELDNLLTETRDSSTDAVRAATAYKDIVDAVENAEKAAEVGLDAAKNSERLLNGTESKAYDAQEKSNELWQNATDSRNRVVLGLEPPLKGNMSQYEVLEAQHKKNKEMLDGIDKLLGQQHSQFGFDPILSKAQETAELAEGLAITANNTIVEEFREV